MLTLLDIALRRFPALESFEHSTRAIATFLGPPPNLLLSEACERGSIATLDWIWTASCTTVEARTPGWSLTNYLRSDPLYYRWQFAKSLYAAAKRGDLEIVEWLFAHFSGCEAPADIVNIAEQQGNLRVLRFLWEHRSHDQKEATKSHPRGDVGSGIVNDCTVEFDIEHDDDDGEGEYWGVMLITKAVKTGQLAQCLDDGMQMYWSDRVSAIKEALRLGNVELAERLVPVGESMLQYATDCAQPEVIEKLLNEGFLRWNEERAATAFKNLAESGSCELMQQISQLHSPLREDNSRWRRTWREAVEAACSGGNLCVLKWLMEHPLGKEVCGEMKQNIPDRGFPMMLLRDAAKKGHVDVMEFLYVVLENINTMDPSTLRDIIQEGQLNSVKWLVDHDMIGDQKAFSWAIAIAARFGHLNILQLFQALDKPRGYEAVGLKRRRTDQAFSLWGGERDTFYWAASGGHVAVLEWLQANYPAECDADAMDAAAYLGHIDAVKWLHANRTEGCTSNAMYAAAGFGRFEVVKWLYVYRPESRTPEAIAKAFRSRHFRIAYWLHSKFPAYKLSQYSVAHHKRLLSYWLCGSPLDALLFLRAIYPSIFTESFVKQTRDDCTSADQTDLFTSTLILRWLDDNYPSTAGTKES